MVRKMTQEERAEARRYIADYEALYRTPSESGTSSEGDRCATALRLALDALEAAERERTCANVSWNLACSERDTARAHVEALAEALRWYGDPENWIFPFAADLEPGDSYEKPAHLDNGDRARAALKAAGV